MLSSTKLVFSLFFSSLHSVLTKHDISNPVAGIPNIQTTLCEEGYYCDGGTKRPCGSIDVFCKVDSVKPTKVYTGHYTIGDDPTTRTGEKLCEPGSYCVAGEKFSCSPGRYGSTYGLTSSDCTGLCQEGYYCPDPGSITATRFHCGHPSRYCPSGSLSPVPVSPGYYSVGGESVFTRVMQTIAPKGYYAEEGLLFQCPAGRYGDSLGLSDSSCSGSCRAGWYCPPGSISPKQKACGGAHRFCPEGSAAPLLVRTGYYTSTIGEECPPGTWRNGTTIVKSFRDDACILCEEGTYKHQQGNDKDLCLKCANAASGTNDRITCQCRKSTTSPSDENLFFNITTNTCESVPIGYHPPDTSFSPDMQFTRTNEIACERGYWCSNGTRYLCPAGTFGHKVKETNPICSGNCSAGYWCGPASTSSTHHECGRANVYCPPGSAAPTYVDEGYFTNEDRLPTVRDSQRLCPPGHWCRGGIRYECPAGRWGGNHGLTVPECDGRCHAGYFCPPTSTSPTQHSCGNVTVYCPEGSVSPLRVDPGFYSKHDRFEPEWLGLLRDPQNTTMPYQEVCQKGYWCNEGRKYHCPEGTYGWLIGTSDVADCRPCRAGYYCPSYPGPPSLNSTARECGNNRFCPERSATPRYIDIGYYGVGSVGETNRTGQSICPLGRYCEDGKAYDCPESTYGNSTGLFTSRCSGFCPAGYYCPSRSIIPIGCPANTYSTPGASKCIRCSSSSVVTGSGEQRCRTARSCCGR